MKWKPSYLIAFGLMFLGLFAVSFFYHDELVTIQLEYNSGDLPMIPVSIDNHKLWCILDTGSNFPVNLKTNTLEMLQKTKLGCHYFSDYLQRGYQSTLYYLPTIQIGDCDFRDIFACDWNPEFETNTTLWNLQPAHDNKEVGFLGRTFLRRTRIYYDFSHSQVVVFKTLHQLKKKNINLKVMQQIPFSYTHTGIILSCPSEMGELRLLLDTGSTMSILNKKFVQANDRHFHERCNYQYCLLQCLKIGKMEVDPLQFYLADLPENSPIDGILGMNYLKQHALYIDYENEVIYLN